MLFFVILPVDKKMDERNIADAHVMLTISNYQIMISH